MPFRRYVSFLRGLFYFPAPCTCQSLLVLHAVSFTGGYKWIPMPSWFSCYLGRHEYLSVAVQFSLLHHSMVGTTIDFDAVGRVTWPVKSSLIWPIMCLVGRWTLLNQLISGCKWVPIPLFARWVLNESVCVCVCNCTIFMNLCHRNCRTGFTACINFVNYFHQYWSCVLCLAAETQSGFFVLWKVCFYLFDLDFGRCVDTDPANSFSVICNMWNSVTLLLTLVSNNTAGITCTDVSDFNIV